tara:strand:+ start:253 stop:438 length:186 start_codon:yes stop_codon:yes gene_type:complete
MTRKEWEKFCLDITTLTPYEMPITYYDGVWSRISDRLLMLPMDDLQLATATQRTRVAVNNI